MEWKWASYYYLYTSLSEVTFFFTCGSTDLQSDKEFQLVSTLVELNGSNFKFDDLLTVKL